MADSVVFTRYIPVKGKERVNNIKVQLYYDLGGFSYWDYKTHKRGYYLSASPVERSVSQSGYAMEGYMLGSGIKDIILEVGRRSDSSARKAKELCTEDRIAELVQYVLNKEGLEVIDNA